MSRRVGESRAPKGLSTHAAAARSKRKDRDASVSIASNQKLVTNFRTTGSDWDIIAVNFASSTGLTQEQYAEKFNIDVDTFVTAAKQYALYLRGDIEYEDVAPESAFKRELSDEQMKQLRNMVRDIILLFGIYASQMRFHGKKQYSRDVLQSI